MAITSVHALACMLVLLTLSVDLAMASSINWQAASTQVSSPATAAYNAFGHRTAIKCFPGSVSGSFNCMAVWLTTNSQLAYNTYSSASDAWGTAAIVSNAPASSSASLVYYSGFVYAFYAYGNAGSAQLNVAKYNVAADKWGSGLQTYGNGLCRGPPGAATDGTSGTVYLVHEDQQCTQYLYNATYDAVDTAFTADVSVNTAQKQTYGAVAGVCVDGQKFYWFHVDGNDRISLVSNSWTTVDEYGASQTVPNVQAQSVPDATLVSGSSVQQQVVAVAYRTGNLYYVQLSNNAVTSWALPVVAPGSASSTGGVGPGVSYEPTQNNIWFSYYDSDNNVKVNHGFLTI